MEMREDKRTVIIYVHPYEKSFNAAMLAQICDKLKADGVPYDVIDLYKDSFNPVYLPEELALFSRGEFLDPLVKKYQDLLRHARRVIFQFPVWWMEAPAMLKGFFDKVMLPGFGYTKEADGRLVPVLDIPETLVVSTSEAPTEVFTSYFEGYFIPFILGTIGMHGAEWLNCPGMTTGTDDNRIAFIETVLARLK